jgi:hypothetical protein
MRFMAMLALCLVAIFALLQGLSPTTSATGEGTDAAGALAPDAAKARRPGPPPPPPPAPVPVAVSSTSPPTASSAAPETAASEPAGGATAAPGTAVPTSPTPETALPAPAPPVAAAQGEGFMLRFDGAATLLALVRRGVVDFFAIDDRGALALRAGRAGLSFVGSAPPSQLYEMEADSVPERLQQAYARARGRRAEAVQRWGVVLPPAAVSDIDALMRAHRGGELVIGADGRVRRR